ncbi:MAG TPA: ClbS/DfsB family four-helix bundle protein [Anaerolineales bacterium]|nr:ClbS/DfsB family four-helix bundle protein [Anaerolineales bacterium]
MAEEQWIPENKSELMTAIRREWGLLIDVIARLDEKQMTAPDAGGWSPRDNLAHLSEWMNSLMGYHMDRRPAHEAMNLPEEITRGWDMEVINPELFERNKDRSSKDVLDELRQTYDVLIAKLEAMSFEDLMKPRHAEDPEKRPLLLWVLGDTTEHFAEHRETIERTLST